MKGYCLNVLWRTVVSAALLATSYSAFAQAVVEPPRDLGSVGSRPGYRDSVLTAGLPGFVSDQKLSIDVCLTSPTAPGCPEYCSANPGSAGCAVPNPGGGGSGGGQGSAWQLYRSCQFVGNAATTIAMSSMNGSCVQAGAFVGMTSANISAVFRAGDVWTASRADFSDPGRYSVTWSGDCNGAGPTCQTASKNATWTGNGASWAATATVVNLATGETRQGDVSAEFMPCGSVGGRNNLECP